MTVKLSPERYLTYPVAMIHAGPGIVSIKQDGKHEVFPYRFKEGYSPHETHLVESLRNARFETLDANNDFESLAYTLDPIDKYCLPIQAVMNAIVLTKTAPELQLLRGTVAYNDNGGRFPAALFVSGRQSFDPFSEAASLHTNEWHPSLTRSHCEDQTIPNWNTVNKCFVAVAFVSPGMIQRQNFIIDDANHLPHICGDLREAFAGLMSLAHNTRATFAILADELTSVIVSFDHYRDDNSLPFLTFKPSTDVHLRLTIAACVGSVASSWCMVRIAPCEDEHPVQGALNDYSSFEQIEEACRSATKKWLSDFDLYTMQRITEVWFSCALWHENAQEMALNRPLGSGSQIKFEPGGFGRRFGLLRSPYPTQHIPKDTSDILAGWMSRKRPRHSALDTILNSSHEVVLTITEAIHTGVKHYSQVFFGRIEGCDEIFCVKLFDERFFSVPWMHDPECTIGRPDTRLPALNYSEDLARREESVYDRLREFQGSLLPQCYGFHMFTLPDGWQCLGLIMEKIDGPTLGSAFPTYDERVQISVITQTRHAVRILRAHGISQTDWHLGQILCQKRDERDVDIVLIDFAFALMYLGDEGGTPTRSDSVTTPQLFAWRLQVDEDLVDKLWLPPLEYEY